MPLTAFQSEVIAVLRAQRHPGSHVAGSIPMHRAADSDRISQDIDLFHDAREEVARSSLADLSALEAAGFSASRTPRWSETFRRAEVRRRAEDGVLIIDWAQDAAIRFFPVVADAQLGWCLHDFDLACNKALALAGREETRDLIDMVAWSRRYPLAAVVWAACGKDPGYNPAMLLQQMRRYARVDPRQLSDLRARAIDPVVLKSQWLALADACEAAITWLADERPDLAIGVAFTDDTATPRWPVAADEVGGRLQVHPPSNRGCWPAVRSAEQGPGPSSGA